MHILLTDVLTCPRCGPSRGLIVLADRLDDRRVRDGHLGCANCREEYPVRDGVADLRHPTPGGAPRIVPDSAEAADAGEAFRLAALLGVAERPGMVLLLGVEPSVAQEVAGLLPDSHAAATLEAGAGKGGPGGAPSWLRADTVLPFRDASLRGVVLAGPAGGPALDEAARVLAPGAHLVLPSAPDDAAGALSGRGFTVLLEQEGVVVASIPAAR